jgi:hypothetical protein
MSDLEILFVVRNFENLDRDLLMLLLSIAHIRSNNSYRTAF